MNVLPTIDIPPDRSRDRGESSPEPHQVDRPESLDPKPLVRAPCHDGFFGLDESQCTLRAEILHRAYSIWESKGRPDNDAVANWLAAEAELKNEPGSFA